jgi:2-amino-4-hydroxy-6-hydroxymethyldihydropteridine diphosphokinase
MKAWLGLGSNLQQPVAQLREALSRLSAEDRVDILRTSCFYHTPPWGDEQQDDFINAVVQIETSLDPVPLLQLLQSIENVMGRQRSERRWGPRLIDIDLLLYGDQQYQSDELEIPHPRMHERAFVLMPLSELDAELEIPGHGGVGKLLQQLDCSDIIRLNDAAQEPVRK